MCIIAYRLTQDATLEHIPYWAGVDGYAHDGSADSVGFGLFIGLDNDHREIERDTHQGCSAVTW